VVCFLLPCGKSPARDLTISGLCQGISRMEGDEVATRLIPRSNEMLSSSTVACDVTLLRESRSSGFNEATIVRPVNSNVNRFEIQEDRIYKSPKLNPRSTSSLVAR